MILTVAQTYPTKENLYNNGFVHARVKAYINEGVEAEAYVLNSRTHKKDYVFENVPVTVGNIEKLVTTVNDNNDITAVCFHFLNIAMVKAIKKFRNDVKIIVFVHGNEALWWYERIFPDRFNGIIRTLKFVKYTVINTSNILYIRNNINKIHNPINIVCVSEWMKDVAMKNWRINEQQVNTHIIPNVVNENIFRYTKKNEELRYNILMIRQFTSGKYALDVAMDIIRLLEEYPEARKMKITIVGKGWLYKKYTSRVKNYSNIQFKETFLTQEEIAELHGKNGIFLCPTRQDAQGVSMCEAMSSGLVPITSNNSAIPEYLPDKYNLSLNSADEAAKRIIEIIRNPEEFTELSLGVSKFIQNKCSRKETSTKEIELIKTMI